MIQREELEKEIGLTIQRSPITAILGPRQCGKTTIAKQLAQRQKSYFFDCENYLDAARLENPLFALEKLEGLIIFDEIQRKPELFEILRVLADRENSNVRFLILGSASPTLIKNASESLAGRVAFIDMEGFTLKETGIDHFRKLWLRGGFPRSFTADSEEESCVWRRDFIRTFLERDIAQLGIKIPSHALGRFWSMVSHFHGQILNMAELARSLGSSESTVRHYIDILCGAFVIKLLPPWFENTAKRIVKAPKIYISDTGLFHTLQNIATEEVLMSHGKVGASWEGFVLGELGSTFGMRNLNFWATHAGAELDILVNNHGTRIGFECKLTDAPRSTKSMQIAIADLKLSHLYVVFPGNTTYPISDRITALSISDLNKAYFL